MCNSIPDSEEWRALNEYEREILGRLFEVDFPGRDDLREQLAHCRVRPLDGLGTIEFIVDAPASKNVNQRVPVEAEAVDSDGELIHYLIHVKNGRMSMLEVYTDTTMDIQRIPRPSDLSTKVR